MKLLFFLFVSGFLFSQDELKKEKYGFGGIPIVNYTSDFGMGLGALGAFYKKEPNLTPYRYELDAQIFFMTSGLQSHRLRFDYVDVADLPLRLRPMLGMIANLSENYCGQGMRAICHEVPNISNYYLTRYLEIFGTVDGRWRLKPIPDKVEILFSWRGSFYRIGDWREKGPYKNSLYAQDFANEPGNGFASILEAGIMLDNRDFEPAPKKGYWIETTLREASPYWGSSWSYIGANLTLRGYLPLEPSKRLILAGQVIFDGMYGDAPLQEITRVGGTNRYFNTYGGQDVGRGLREQYFPGRLKAYKQLELRYEFVGFNFWMWHFDLSAISFADLGLTAWSFDTLSQDRFKPAVGFGGGLRILWDKTVVLRFDTGFSPIESYSPKFYIAVGNIF